MGDQVFSSKFEKQKRGLPGPIYLLAEIANLFYNDFLCSCSALSSEVDEVNPRSPAR